MIIYAPYAIIQGMGRKVKEGDSYAEKEAFLSADYERVTPRKFYRELFPVGSFEPEIGYQEDYPKTGKGNGIVVFGDEKKLSKHLVFDDLKELSKAAKSQVAFMSPIGYFGRSRTAANARLLYALTFDLDGVGREQISYLFDWFRRLPKPTYIVNSGGGLHLYYFFDKPVPMYPKLQQQLKKLKYALTDRLWNIDTSNVETKQFQGINQGFRLVGSRTKKGKRVTAYRTGERVSLAYLSEFVDPENRVTDTLYHSKMTLEEARKKYPDWYQQRIIDGRQSSNWVCKRALYDWWLKRAGKVVFHHRYFFVMCLAVYAVKCDIPFEELKKDAYNLLPMMNSKGDEFTKADVKSALEMYQESYRSFPRSDIEKLSGLPIPKNKRNGRTRAQHLLRARAMRDINQAEQGTKWNGRKSAEPVVKQFLEQFPNGTAADFVELAGLSRRVFFKYKN